MLIKNSKKQPNEYYCENCTFTTCKLSNYNNHLLTRKHKMLIKKSEKQTK